MRAKVDANKGMKRKNTNYPKFTVMDSNSFTISNNEDKEIESDNISTNSSGLKDSSDHKISSSSNSEDEEILQEKCLSETIKVESQTPPSKKIIPFDPREKYSETCRRRI